MLRCSDHGLEPQLPRVQIQTDIRRFDNPVHFCNAIPGYQEHIARFQHDVVLQVTPLLYIVQVKDVDFIVISIDASK